MNIITAQTGNEILDYASIGIRFCAGYALAAYAIWNSNASMIATTAATVATTALFLSQSNTSTIRRATAPLVIGATSALLLIAALRLYRLDQQYDAYISEQGLSHWRINLRLGGSSEQWVHLNALISAKRDVLFPVIVSTGCLFFQVVTSFDRH